MAIVFTKEISEVNLLNAYNNNIVKFGSDSVKTLKKASISITGVSNPFVISPISDSFTFNFKNVSKAVINSNRYKDEALPTNDITVDNTLKGVYTITYTVTFTDDTSEQVSKNYNFLRAVSQIGEYVEKPKTEQHVLNQTSLTVFKGYPFDFARFSDGDVTISNTTNGKSKVLSSTAEDVNRVWINDGEYPLVVSDGEEAFEDRMIAASGTVRTNECMIWVEDEVLPIGYNNVSLIGQNGTIPMTIRVKDECEGVYLKCVNQDGSYSYWLFSKIFKDELSSSTVDTVNVDHSDILDTFATTLITGKTSVKTKQINYKGLTRDEMQQVKDFVDSPRVELYLNDKNTFVTNESWQTVLVKDVKIIEVDTKRQLSNIKLTLVINKYTL